ncbi:MAG: tetratricopeptide repeat protein [Cyanobacteria bacterium]|nr:tetratricopeptide repeat protein [Cyanobacteriota bacterium]
MKTSVKTLLAAIAVPVVLSSLPLLGWSECKASNKVSSNQTFFTSSNINSGLPSGVFTPSLSNLSPENQTRYTEWFTKGQTQLVDRQYPEAVETFEQVLNIDPQSVPAYRNMAEALYFQGYYTKSLNMIDKAISLDPVNAKLFFVKGQVLEALNRGPEAIEAYLTFINWDPTDSSSLTAQRKVNELYDRYETRLTAVQREYFSGLRLLSMQNAPEAIPFFKRVAELEPTNINNKLFLGMAYRMSNQNTQAIAEFEALTKVQPDNGIAYFQLGRALEWNGQQTQAQQAWQRFVKTTPNSSQAGLIQRKMNVN